MLEEVENEAEIVFPAADGGIIENKGLDVDDNVTDGAVQPFEIVEADIAVNGRVFKATSDDICPLMRLCWYNMFWEGGCSTLTGRDLNFIVEMFCILHNTIM